MRRQSRGRRLIEPALRRGELTPVALEGAGKHKHWARPRRLKTSEVSMELVHILSPFDPLIIQRKRTDLFFGYSHRFEAYVPKEKRQARLFRTAGTGRRQDCRRESI